MSVKTENGKISKSGLGCSFGKDFDLSHKFWGGNIAFNSSKCSQGSPELDCENIISKAM